MDVWSLILQLKDTCKSSSNIRYISVILNGPDIEILVNELTPDAGMFFSFDGIKHNGDSIHIDCSVPFLVSFTRDEKWDDATYSILEKYLPYAFLPYFAKEQDKIFVVSHFAQTLDGKIATSTGDSRWIGNEENLIHAHRMRALCDAVLVGRNTFEVDAPQLNVRHVQGPDPLQVVIGAEAHLSASTRDNRIFINTHSLTNIDENEKDVHELLSLLKERGITSVYLEGGSTTSSSFLKQQAIDQVQIHFSSKILGSGIPGFNFDGVISIAQCVQFKNPRFVPMDNEIMFLGEC